MHHLYCIEGGGRGGANPNGHWERGVVHPALKKENCWTNIKKHMN